MTPSPGRKKRSTILDVATVAGISRGTVSRVLNGEPYVSDEARVAVNKAIKEVGYVPNMAARNLVRQRSQAVGLLIHEPHALFLEDPNIGSIMLGANTVLSQAGYQMVCLIIDSELDVNRIGQYLNGGSIDGAIVISAGENDPITELIEQLAMASAFVGLPPNHRPLPFVSIDNKKAAAEITARLKASGRTQIGMIASALGRAAGADRLAGFEDALGSSYRPELVAMVEHFSFDAGIAGMRELLERCPTIDAVFAASDAVAAGALSVLQRIGRRVPEDIAVVGFDDSVWAQRTNPPLSTVRQPASELGAQAAELVLAQLRGEEINRGGVYLETSIVWRDSA
ncbi:LacI family DNA-binding transcriptional regulator [Arthrobacter glacialis]|uniref:LacI family transcriptional regulator n=1 Tax=Arthrobacter glacialis TaxID=1664 RepID=A0A2S3ZSN0_ARTGL|nr:LacI family DNA-binding transcriptional regulator [Arthrobacter glacialis]POH57062.1 LacI family transcriptional regulator [Arthrobacter glacialis]POH72104.1 LacI family transcriptional regulator [Arthrobacter glacialis]